MPGRDDFVPGMDADNGQGKAKRLFPFRRVGQAKDFVDFLLLVGRRDGSRFSAPKSEVQSTLVGIVDVTIEDEGVDSLEPRCLDPAVAITGRLQGFAVGTVGRVESLFRKDHPPRLAVAEHYRTAEIGGQLL